MLFDAEKRNRFERIVNYVAKVYAPMFLRVHLESRAFHGPENAIFLRGLLLFFNKQDPKIGVRSHQKVLFETCCSMVESH